MAILDLDHLSYNFGDNWALKNVSFRLEKGEFLFLTGPSGAGKTTLLRILYGDLPVLRGQAAICGLDLRKVNSFKLPILRRQLGMVFQDFKILPERSVYDNVALALEVRFMPRPQIDRRVRAVLRSLNIATKAEARCSTLSGGEQQRVAIARAIVVNPRILLADEPSGNLDPRLSLRLMEIFKHFNAHGTTVILATHSPELLKAKRDARILHLVDGSVAGVH